MANELLKDVSIKNAKAAEKDPRLNDGNGLYLLVKPNAAKWWRFDYTIEGKRKTLSLGVYPETGLADARRKAEQARTNVANGIDPSGIRKEAKKIKEYVAEQKRRVEAGLTAVGSFAESAYHWVEYLKNHPSKRTGENYFAANA